MQKLGETYLQIFKRDKNVLQCTKDYKYTYTHNSTQITCIQSTETDLVFPQKAMLSRSLLLSRLWLAKWQ